MRAFYFIVAVILVNLTGILIWVFTPPPESQEPAFSGMGSTYITALLPAIELGEREPLNSADRKETDANEQATGVLFPGSTRRLVVVIPGLGGNSIDSMNLWFARPFLKRQDTVWILPSPTHQAYARRYLQKVDFAESVESLCSLIDSRLSKETSKGFEELVLSGYSLGARHVIALSDCIGVAPNARRLDLSILALNPPLSLTRASQILDEGVSHAYANPVSTLMMALYFRFAQKFLSNDVTLNDFLQRSHADLLHARSAKFIPLVEHDTETLKALVASVFNRKLRATYSGIEPEARTESETVSETGSGFFHRLVARSSGDKFSDVLSVGDLNHVVKMTKGRFLFIHSRDDFLIQPDQLDPIVQAFPNNVEIYPSGGHVGVIFQENYLAGTAQLGQFK